MTWLLFQGAAQPARRRTRAAPSVARSAALVIAYRTTARRLLILPSPFGLCGGPGVFGSEEFLGASVTKEPAPA